MSFAMVYGKRPVGFQSPYNTSTRESPDSCPGRPAHTTFKLKLVRENEGQQAETYSGDVWMIDPWFQNKWSYAVYHHDRIVVLGSHREHEVVSSCPGRQVLPAKTSQLYDTA